MNEENTSAIDFIEVPASSILPVAKTSTEKGESVDIKLLNEVNRSYWTGKSATLLDSYRFGESFAKFGENTANIKTFFDRFGCAIRTAISNECQNRATGSEDLKPIYTIFENSLSLLAKEFDKKNLKDFNILSIISAMHGFISNYADNKHE